MNTDEHRYDGYIARAKVTKGGHLHIGRGGFTLCYSSSRLSGYDCDEIKALCIAAGLPVIDSRSVPIDVVAKLAVSGPMTAVNADADPRPWHAFSYAHLGAVAAAYRRAGAEVFNIDETALDETGFMDPSEPSLAGLIDGWLAYVQRAAA